MADPWLRLSTTELFLLWAAAELGDPPALLHLRHVGRTRAERAELAEQAAEDLLARGLGSVARPAEDLTEALLALGRRELTFSLGTEAPEGRLRAIAATGSAGCAIAVVVGSDVALRMLRPAGLIDALVAELAPLPAGPGDAANVAWADYLRACAEGERDGVDGFIWALRDAGTRLPEAHTVARVLTERQGAGQLDIGGRSGGARVSVNWIDTAGGRYVLRHRGDWLSVIPADPAKLVQLITESLACA